ncbi:MAG: cbb3-type cytochrome c oxidase N-terminal domain-containing protein [Bacteroidales bacterium]
MDPHDNNIIEKDELTGDKLISGHEYDNIRELDNNLPKWWLGLFIITIVFAVVYVLRYHIMDSAPLQEEEYENEMVAAGQAFPTSTMTAVLDTASLTQDTDQGSLSSGKEIWDKNCVVCHLAQGQGIVGPNLTDEYWIHGCSYKDVYKVITEGVPDKGMIAWKNQLSPDQIKMVSSFVMTLIGTNPPNPKAPQGEKCE